jgi:hypothetical protein
VTIRVPKVALIVVVVVAAGAGIGVGAYFAGRSSIDTRRHFSAGFATGFKAGYASGEENGERSGEAIGQGRGKHEGETQGRRQGQTAGQNEPFEGYSGGWEIGSWYIIKIGAGQEAGLQGKYNIPTRVGPMRQGRAYSLCEGGICSEGVPGG